MRQLLNTLFVTSEDIYLSLDGENVVANRGGEAVARYPLHTLQSIVSFSYAGASPALMGGGRCNVVNRGRLWWTANCPPSRRVSGASEPGLLARACPAAAAGPEPPRPRHVGGKDA